MLELLLTKKDCQLFDKDLVELPSVLCIEEWAIIMTTCMNLYCCTCEEDSKL